MNVAYKYMSVTRPADYQQGKRLNEGFLCLGLLGQNLFFFWVIKILIRSDLVETMKILKIVSL